MGIENGQPNYDHEFEPSGDFDPAEQIREQHRAISENLVQLRAELVSAENLDEEQSKRFFGLGAYFGRKKFLEQISRIAEEISSYQNAYRINIEDVGMYLADIRENADCRQYLLQHDQLSVDEAEKLSNEEVRLKLAAYQRVISAKFSDATEINKLIRAGYLTLSEASSENADEYLDRARADLHRQQNKEYQRGERLEPINLCFIRRSEYLPEIEDGVAYVRTPISAVDDPDNPHLARISSHWSVNHAASDPGLYGKYGNGVIIACEGDRFIEGNGLPKRIEYNDVYWLHDIALPAGSKIFCQHGYLSEQQIEEYNAAGLEVVFVDDIKNHDEIQNSIASWGYSSVEVDRGLKEFASRLNIEYGEHSGDETDIATRLVLSVILAIREFRLGNPQVTNEIVNSKYDECIEGIAKTMGMNPRAKEQIGKIKELLCPVVKKLLSVAA